jgi:hypothetical protein
MLRLWLTILLVTVILGGTWWYTRFVNQLVPQPASYRPQLSTSRYSLEILRTFVAVPGSELEPTSTELQSLDRESPALTVFFKGNVLYQHTGRLDMEEPLAIQQIPGIEIGENEIFVKALLLPPQPMQLQALQVRLFREGRPLSETTVSGYPGSPLIYATVLFEVAD